jgi:transposase InsO family protein
MKYRKYDPLVKKLIIQSGNKNLFPELNIPRTTISYWLKESKEIVTSEIDHVYEIAIKRLEEKLYQSEAKNYLVKKCLEKVFKESEFYDEKSKKNRKFLVELIEEFKELITLKDILKIIGLSASTYYRWKVDILGCQYNQLRKCPVTRPHQLSRSEQDTLIKYATSKHFSKFSTVSLVYYCKRKNLLNCSLESWYRYMKLYGVTRRTTPRKTKKYKNGLRAKRINEFWHIDITEVKYGESEKAYLQIVVDNYSRFIVGWKIGLKKDMKLTYKTMLCSLNKNISHPVNLMSDGGGENIGELPKKLLLGKGIKQLIAKKDIRFSNSMIEAVFRQFKQRFLIGEVKSYKSLYQLVYKFVQQYNNIIPHSKLFGATPAEEFSGSFCRSLFKVESKNQHIESKLLRKREYSKCVSCRKGSSF